MPDDTTARKSISSFDCIMICSVIALSMPKKTLKRFVYKYDLMPKRKQFDYGYGFYLLHQYAHEVNGRIAKALDSYMNKQHVRYMNQLEALNAADVKSVKSFIEKGFDESPGGILWSLLSEPRNDLQSQGVYYAHKIVYQLLRDVALNNINSSETEDDSPELKQQLSSFQKENAVLQKDIQERSADLVKAEKQIEGLEKELDRLTGKISDLENRPSREGRLLRENRKLQYELAALQNSYDTKVSEMFTAKYKQPSATPETEIEPISVELCEQAVPCPLNALRIAVVGGLERLEQRYRSIVENLGGEFVFHNGYCNNGTHSLKNIVCGSDIVIFITSINSHNAMWVVKTECKKSGKRFTVMKKASPDALEKTLLAEAAG